MGCDIHAFVETTTTSEEKEYWNNFAEEFRLDRNYGMFGFLAGVRTDDKPIVPARGLPTNLASTTENSAYLRISNEFAEEDGFCSLENAQKYQGYGSNIVMRDGKPYKVSHPDWHSHSWLTLEEFDKVIAAYKARYVIGEAATDNKRWMAEYAAISAAMKVLQDFDQKVRLVFWFDN